MTETQKTHPRVIAFNYVLKNSQGEQLDASEPNQPLPFLEGRQQIIPVLEAEILKMAEKFMTDLKFRKSISKKVWSN
jgi:FKBP-type peptidyl-prolyl cis-trans isomerase 2